MAARRALNEEALASLRVREDALHAKNRTKPPEAYLPHTFAVLEAVRPVGGDELPAGIKALVKRCEEAGASYDVAKTLATDTDGFDETTYVESVSFRARGVFVAYENGKFARALSSAFGKGTLTDAKRALGIEVKERAPRTAKSKTAAPKPTGKTDTLR